ncbi:hypothetical protein Tco_0912120 [Tanacetum coccineum]
MEQMTSICDMVGQIMQKKEEERRIVEEQAAKDRYWKIPICYDDDEDYTIAITPVLSTEEPVNSLIMEDEHLSTSVENLVPIPSEFKGISEDTCDVPVCEDPSTFDALSNHSEILSDSNNDGTSSDDDSYENIEYIEASPLNLEIVSLEEVNDVDQEKEEFDLENILQIQDVILHEKLLNISRLVTNIESLKNNPTPDYVFKSPSSFPIPVMDSNSFFEESDTSLSHLDNSLPEFETFSDHTEETRSGSTTTHANNSLPEYEDYEAFDDDHIKEKSSGSTTTHVDFSKYDSFIFDLSINLFPPADRSNFHHEEFADELAHIISPSEYDHLCFKIEPELGNLTMDEVEDIFPTKEPRVHVPNVLSTHTTLSSLMLYGSFFHFSRI